MNEDRLPMSFNGIMYVLRGLIENDKDTGDLEISLDGIKWHKILKNGTIKEINNKTLELFYQKHTTKEIVDMQDFMC